MPYKTNADLPESVKHALPSHAKDIYRAAFNHAWKEYKDVGKRNPGDSQEDVARKVAWAAVKKVYKKKGDTWQKK